MVAASGRFVLSFNGEIYNYREVKAQLEAANRSPAWRGNSDTEVFLAACDAWGVEDALRKSNGMFALAIWDSKKYELILARDRMGEKPLYFGWAGSVLLFGSELKALERHPGFHRRLDRRAVSAYLRFGYVPVPLSIYDGIQKVGAAEIVRIGVGQGSTVRRKSRYWNVPVPSRDVSGAEGVSIEALHGVLKEAVKSRMHADVPLGAFLSGGIDSSLIAALMQDAGGGRVRTYSVGFEDRTHDEAVYAAAVARALGTAHHELYVKSQDALDVVPFLPQLYDEPFADSSQIPTFLLSKMTRQHVTVALSGDAGDELFGGYVRYFQARRLQALYAVAPKWGRGVVASMLREIAKPTYDSVRAFGPRALRVAFSSDRLVKLASVIELDGCQQMYARLVSQWPDSRIPAPQLPAWESEVDDVNLRRRIGDLRSWMMYLDSITYLPDDILVKVDRASMAASLEVRVPLLDHRVVEFAARIPLSFKIRGGVGKWALRQVLYRYVDRSLIDRPKQGFGVPLAEWLRGSLREWAEELLSEKELAESGLVDVSPIRMAWKAHLSGRENVQYRLWVVLMLQAWLRRSGASVH